LKLFGLLGLAVHTDYLASTDKVDVVIDGLAAKTWQTAGLENTLPTAEIAVSMSIDAL